jgi:hypothetical protein
MLAADQKTGQEKATFGALGPRIIQFGGGGTDSDFAVDAGGWDEDSV